MVMKKISKISIDEQVRLLLRYYPGSHVELNKNRGFSWIGDLRSSPIGDLYKIKILFERNKKPEIFVIEPKKLRLANGNLRLKHVYNHESQKLCLYYPIDNEWNEGKMIASTIIPWAIEWLYHYEMWLITEEWLGGGIHSSDNSKI